MSKQLETMMEELICVVGNTNASVEELKQEVREIKATQVRMENDLIHKVGLLLDGWQQHDEKLDRVLKRLDTIEEKVESHDIRISVLDRRKAK